MLAIFQKIKWRVAESWPLSPPCLSGRWASTCWVRNILRRAQTTSQEKAGPSALCRISVPCFLAANNLFKNTLCSVLVGTFYKYLGKCVQDFTILFQPVREAYLYFLHLYQLNCCCFVCLFSFWEPIFWHEKLLRKCLALWTCPLRKGGLTVVCSSQRATVRDLSLPPIAISTIVKAKGLCLFFQDPPNQDSTGPGTTLKTTWGVPFIDQHTYT